MEALRKPKLQSHDASLRRLSFVIVTLVLGPTLVPAALGADTGERMGEEIVQKQCSSCHQEGLNGAPRIGDRAAWIPRMSKGLDVLVRSAVHGHGAMPARGGMADLSDRELESAIVYMFNYGVARIESSPPVARMAADPFHKSITGADVYLGVVRAESMPAAQRPASIASGKGYYHVNISLVDEATKAPVQQAVVRVSVTDAVGIETKTLEAVSLNDSISYRGYFRMTAGSTYTITALIERPGMAGVAEAKFTYKP
ncbi:MAG TPA: c-type cytochrome [Burkholderiaceae bacterium]|nr:c-type cytochrome [Burkholderiaceae bacterium]